MTTQVIVKANHGWPVRVQTLNPKCQSGNGDNAQIVQAGREQSFSVWDGQDLQIHEIQPSESGFAENGGKQ